jgi:hypothetical protein
MTIFNRFNIGVIAAGAGLCGVAIALGPDVAAAPLTTGGCAYAQAAGQAGTSPVAAGGAPAGVDCSPASAPLADMAGVPLALPGPVPLAAPVPVAAPLPVVAPVPVAAPVPAPAGAPLAELSGSYGGKGQPTGPLPDGAPVPGQPIQPGPAG